MNFVVVRFCWNVPQGFPPFYCKRPFKCPCCVLLCGYRFIWAWPCAATGRLFAVDQVVGSYFGLNTFGCLIGSECGSTSIGLNSSPVTDLVTVRGALILVSCGSWPRYWTLTVHLVRPRVSISAQPCCCGPFSQCGVVRSIHVGFPAYFTFRWTTWCSHGMYFRVSVVRQFRSFTSLPRALGFLWLLTSLYLYLARYLFGMIRKSFLVAF